MTMAAIDFQLLANAGFPPAQFKAGEVVFAEGDEGDKMYVILSARVETRATAIWSRHWRQAAFSARWR